MRSPPLKQEQPSPSKTEPAKKADQKPLQQQKSEESLQKGRIRLMRQPTFDQSSPTAMVEAKEAAKQDGKDVVKDMDKEDVNLGDYKRQNSKAGIKNENDKKSPLKKQKSGDSLQSGPSRQTSHDKLVKETVEEVVSDLPEETDDTAVTGRQSSAKEQKAALLSKFETTKADPKAKLTRKSSGKRQRVSDSKQTENASADAPVATGTSLLPKEVGVPVKIPGHSRFEHLGDGHSHSVPSVSELPNFIESLGVSQEGWFDNSKMTT